jgi:hypothetical protein
MFEAFDIGLDVAVEQVQQVAKLLGVADIETRLDLAAVLVEDGGGCVFEDRVGKGIAEGDLLADFFVELVGGVFGFPVAVVEVERVAERAVGADLFAADARGELRDEVPVGFFAGGGEQVLEGGAGGAFVGDFVRGVAGEFFVVALDFFVGRFELVGIGHGAANRGEGGQSPFFQS